MTVKRPRQLQAAEHIFGPAKITKVSLMPKIQIHECGESCKPHINARQKIIIELGVSRPMATEYTYNVYNCKKCRVYFTVPFIENYAPKKSPFSWRVIQQMVQYATTHHTREAVRLMRLNHYICVGQTTIDDWIYRRFGQIP